MKCASVLSRRSRPRVICGSPLWNESLEIRIKRSRDLAAQTTFFHPRIAGSNNRRLKRLNWNRTWRGIRLGAQGSGTCIAPGSCDKTRPICRPLHGSLTPDLNQNKQRSAELERLLWSKKTGGRHFTARGGSCIFEKKRLVYPSQILLKARRGGHPSLGPP